MYGILELVVSSLKVVIEFWLIRWIRVFLGWNTQVLEYDTDDVYHLSGNFFFVSFVSICCFLMSHFVVLSIEISSYFVPLIISIVYSWSSCSLLTTYLLYLIRVFPPPYIYCVQRKSVRTIIHVKCSRKEGRFSK